MEFSDPINYNGIIQQCEMNLFGDAPFGSISDNPDRLALFTALINAAYGRYAILALMADNAWQFDDNNYSDFPIATTDLNAGQPDYTLNNNQIIIEQVEVLDPTGKVWLAVPEGDERKFAEYKISESQYFNNVAAVPIFHIKKGNSILLMPTPSYGVPQGLKVRFKRPVNYFVSTDTTKMPGFNRLHHLYLADYASYRYAFMRTLAVAGAFGQAVQVWEQTSIPQFYNSRSVERQHIMRSIQRSSR